jgi:glycosidase
MRKSLFIFLLLTVVIISPLTQVEADETIENYNRSIQFSWTGSATTVELVGEWNWDERISMIENNGVWIGELNLSEGIYCYKFIVDEEFIFDPSNPLRGYCGDIENSIIRVKDSTRPIFEIDLQGQELVVTFIPGKDGAGPAGTPTDLSDSNWDSESLQWTLDISNFEDGKHTLRLEINDTNGNIAYDELVPFWVGEQAEFSWEDSLIYMILTDRFVNGNTSNDPISTGAAQGADWQGGDLEGVTQMIESGYFSEMGVNVLWLTPFNTAANGTGKASDGVHDVSSFHGYWPVEPRQVDPRLGTEEQLKSMVNAAHDAGIRVMMDYVVNHVHEDHTYYQNNPEWFNQGCICGTSTCDWTENRLDCQFTSYMPDVNWKNRNASEQFIEDALWWLEEFDLDGARIDAVKHVDDLAITNLVDRISQRFETAGTDYYLKGETAMGWVGHELADNQEQYETINRYMGENGLDGQADFVLYHAVVDNVFTTGNENYQHLDYWTSRSQDQYEQGSIMVPFVGSHDVPRIISRADTGTGDAWNQWSEDGLPGQPGNDESYQAVLQAYGWLLTTPGAPMIYYGDEYGEFGGADPDNRHSFRESTNWNERERSLQENISKLGQLRLQSDALRRGTYESLYNSPDVLVFERATEKSSALVVLNRGESNDSISLNLANYTNAFGSAIILEGLLTVPSNSVSVLIRENNSSNESEIIEEPEIIIGCTDINATNYDVNAEEDDGNCTYEDDTINDNVNNNIENNTTNLTNITIDQNNTLDNSNDDNSSQEECEEAGGIWNGDWEECNEEDNQICIIEDENGLIIDCEDYNQKRTFMPKAVIVKSILLISVILASIVLFVISRQKDGV